MKARTLGIFAVATALVWSFQAHAKDINISHQFKAHKDGRDVAARWFAKEVTKRDPSLKFRIYPGKSLIKNPKSQIVEMQKGSLEMSVYPLVYASGKIPEYGVTLMPAAVSGLGHAWRLKNTRFHEILQEVAHNNGIHILTWWWMPGGFATKDRAIGSPGDVKDLKMRGAGPYFELLLKAAGASIHSMASSEVYSALQTGVLDGLLTTCESLLSFRLYEQTKHVTAPGDFSLFITIVPLVISKQHWDGLTDAQRNIFTEVGEASNKFFHESQNNACDRMVAKFKKAGSKVHVLTQSEFDAWAQLGRKSAWVAFAKKAKRGQELIDSILAVK